MKTSRLLLITTAAAILACSAPVASARPAMDPATARPHKAQASNMATIAAHKEQLSTQQYLASHGTSAEAQPLTDRTGTDTDNGFPVAFVLIGLSIPLALGLAAIASKPVRAYAAHRRPPARVA
jgi:hypothetical protein